jgi:hypothetical protein
MSVNEAATSMTSREMKDHLDVVDRASRKAAISQITLEHLNPVATAVKILQSSARQVICYSNRSSETHQAIDKMTTDERRPTGYKHSRFNPACHLPPLLT